MTDNVTRRGIPPKAIPPGINDERTRDLIAAFNAMASGLDFASLLMRSGEETPDDALPLAIHDRSLEEFMPPDGLPPVATRRLLDNAWDLHERKGTDGGVILGQELLGIHPQITQWYEQDPVGQHDTHKITVYVNEHLYEGEATLLNEKIQRASLKMIHATKRWSQESSYSLGVGFDSDLGIAARGRGHAFARTDGATKLPLMGSSMGLESLARSHGLVRTSGEAKLPAVGIATAVGMTGRAMVFIKMEGELQ